MRDFANADPQSPRRAEHGIFSGDPGQFKKRGVFGMELLLWLVAELNALWGDGLGAVTGAVGALGAVGAFAASAANWLHARRLERRAAEPVKVRLVLEGEGRSIDLPLEMRRRDLSRAELLGRLGMLPMRELGRRFSLRHLAKPAFMRDLARVLDGESAVLTIPASIEELDQFDI